MRPAVRIPVIIAYRDAKAAFARPIGYGLTAGFLVLAGVLLVLALRAGEARLDGWFAPLYLLTGVLAALLGMRSFAEEEAAGSLEVLTTGPFRPWQLVMGKLGGVMIVFSIVAVATFVAPFLLASMGDPDLGPVVTGYIGLFLLGAAFLSVAVAASAATASQLVAGAVAVGILMGLWFGTVVVSGLDGPVRTVVEYLSPSNHVTGFLRGTLALDDVVYFLSLAIVGIVVAAELLRSRR